MQPHKKPSRTSSISRLVSELRETAALDEAEVDNTLTPQRFARLGRRNIRVLLNVARLDALKKLQLHAQAPDAKKEEFRRYLERSGVIDALTKGEPEVILVSRMSIIVSRSR